MLATSPILTWGIIISATFYLLAFCFNILRIFVGPSSPDRIAALDAITFNAIGPVILMGIGNSTHFDFETALLISLFGFLTVVALCKYILRGMIIE